MHPHRKYGNKFFILLFFMTAFGYNLFMRDFALDIITKSIQFFFIMTPFFALSMFLTLTNGMEQGFQRKLALKITLSIIIINLIILFFGHLIFSIFGITVDAFRIGAGALLFLTAVQLNSGKISSISINPDEDISVVPFSIPIIIGPATIGTLLVESAAMSSFEKVATNVAAELIACVLIGILLLTANFLEKILGKRGINILTKLTALILAALSAQMIFTGMRGLLLG